MNDLGEMLQVERLRTIVQTWFQDQVLVVDNAVQVAVLVIALVVARFFGPRLRAYIEKQMERRQPKGTTRAFFTRLSALSVPIVLLVIAWLAVAIAAQAGWSNHILRTVASLTNAWVVIHLASGLIRNEAWSKLIAGAAWTLAALTTLGLFDATVEFLDGLAIAFGGVRISVLTVVKGVFALAVLMWVAFSVSRVLEARIRKAPNLTPSIQVLMGKLTKIVLITIALLIALESVGIDLTALTVFGGMLGVGIGFGMQKIVSNFVSGLILLMDKSIAPGDVIAVGETYGWIVSLGARYASVRTRDGTEHLIPNEEIITQRVENWSHSDRAVRFKIPGGISYGSDVRLAIKLCLEAANEVGRVLKDPETKCLLKGFGDSSVDLEIRIWVNDPENGRSNIKSEVLLGVWDRFHENNIEIPFPQRDLHVKSCDVPAFLAN